MIHRDPNAKRQYVAISNDTIRDNRLSFAARGLLAYILSFSNDWVITRSRLIAATGATEYEIKKLMKELTDNGYCRVVRVPRGDRRGTKWQAEFYEVSMVENRRVENRWVENRTNENHPILENHIKENHIKEKHIISITKLNDLSKEKEKLTISITKSFQVLTTFSKTTPRRVNTMNRLKQLMFTYGISSYKLSKMTGMSAYNIRRLCTGDAINNAHIKTLTTLGDVFGISPLEVKGDDPRAITDPLEARVRLKVYELANL